VVLVFFNLIRVKQVAEFVLLVNTAQVLSLELYVMVVPVVFSRMLMARRLACHACLENIKTRRQGHRASCANETTSQTKLSSQHATNARSARKPRAEVRLHANRAALASMVRSAAIAVQECSVMVTMMMLLYVTRVQADFSRMLMARRLASHACLENIRTRITLLPANYALSIISLMKRNAYLA